MNGDDEVIVFSVQVTMTVSLLYSMFWMLFQETKVDEDAKPSNVLAGYEQYFNCCTSTKGYAGTAYVCQLALLLHENQAIYIIKNK